MGISIWYPASAEFDVRDRNNTQANHPSLRMSHSIKDRYDLIQGFWNSRVLSWIWVAGRVRICTVLMGVMAM